jgi:surface protein
MYFLFSGCTNLEYVDISNFDLTKTSRAGYLFQNCKNLKYINFKNVIVGNSTELVLMFERTSEDFTYCINNNSLIINQLKNKSCVINDCSDDWNLKIKKKNK